MHKVSFPALSLLRVSLTITRASAVAWRALCLAPELKQSYMTKSPQEMIHKLAQRFPIVGQWPH